MLIMLLCKSGSSFWGSRLNLVVWQFKRKLLCSTSCRAVCLLDLFQAGNAWRPWKRQQTRQPQAQNIYINLVIVPPFLIALAVTLRIVLQWWAMPCKRLLPAVLSASSFVIGLYLVTWILWALVFQHYLRVLDLRGRLMWSWWVASFPCWFWKPRCRILWKGPLFELSLKGLRFISLRMLYNALFNWILLS